VKFSWFSKNKTTERVIYFETYLSGANLETFGVPQYVIEKLTKVGDEVVLIWDNENTHDPCAMAVAIHKYLDLLKRVDNWFIGWIPASMNHQICEDFQRGKKVKGVILEKQKPTNEYNYWNVKIQVYREEEN
jgi:hypothetical protein